jgi:hypothetical protein
MKKIFLRVIVAIIAVTLVLETPPAYAIFGIRAARTVLAARKAKQMASSSGSDADKAYAEEAAKFGKKNGRSGETRQGTETGTDNVFEDRTRP